MQQSSKTLHNPMKLWAPGPWFCCLLHLYISITQAVSLLCWFEIIKIVSIQFPYLRWWFWAYTKAIAHTLQQKNKATAKRKFSRTSLPFVLKTFVFHHFHSCVSLASLSLFLFFVLDPEKNKMLSWGNLYHVARNYLFSQKLIAC